MKKYAVLLIFIISLAVNVFFCAQKDGFHEDEYYTYYSSNRTYGLYQPDREWQDRETILNEFVVKPDEGFNYGLVKLVQSWDVHPPVYYYIFHTICSFKPGVFTKWTGLITNLIAFSLSFLVLTLIMDRLKLPLYLELLALGFFGCNPQTISCNLLVRMYVWLTLFILLCAYNHIRMIQGYQSQELSMREYILKYLVPIMITSFIGFLIQYFYLFFFFIIGVTFSAWIFFWKKDVKKTVTYVCACVISLGLAVLYYPASAHHMFGGYRGNEAAGSLFDISNTVMRISFFTGLLNDYVFAGALFVIILIIVAGVVMYIIHPTKQSADSVSMIILTIASIGYFLVTAKAALLVGDASNRYEMPIYSLIIVIVAVALDKALDHLLVINKSHNLKIALLAAIFTCILIKGLWTPGNVLFLYSEDEEKILYAAGHRNDVAVVMFNPATPYNVWRLTNELLEYPSVYYMNEENTEAISDRRILDADRVILYAADDELQDEAFTMLEDTLNLKNRDLIATELMWKTYELY